MGVKGYIYIKKSAHTSVAIHALQKHLCSLCKVHLKWHLRRQVIYFLDSYFLLVSLMYTQSVKYHKYKHGFKCLREMGDVVPPQTNTGKVLCICSHLDMCSHYVFPLYSAVIGKASAKVLGRFNLWIIMQLFLTVATILLLVQVTHSNVSFFDKNYAQTLVDADRTSLFLVDNRTNELYARIFDIGGSLEDSRSSNLQKEIRW